jgi:serine/threonine-protein kinase
VEPSVDKHEREERAKQRLGELLCGKYRLERVLGSGGMATVFAARHVNGHAVAIKLLHATLSADERAVGNFRHEATIGHWST